MSILHQTNIAAIWRQSTTSYLFLFAELTFQCGSFQNATPRELRSKNLKTKYFLTKSGN